MVVDFADIDAVANPIIKHLCHSNLNHIIDNPTSEHLCLYLLMKITLADGIEVWETENSKCVAWR